MDQVELTRRSASVWTALDGLTGPERLSVLVAAVVTLVKDAPAGIRAKLRTTVMLALKQAGRGS